MQRGAVGGDWSLLATVYAQDHGVEWISLRGGGGEEESSEFDADWCILDGLITIQLQFSA